MGSRSDIRYLLPVRNSLLVLLLAASGLLGSSPVSAQRPFEQGPYVDRLVRGAATVHVRTDEAVAVRVTFEAGGQAIATRESRAGRAHAVLVSGLPDGTEIRYRVEAPGFTSANGRFRTPRVDLAAPVDFLVVGDCRDGDADHARTLRTMRGEHDFLLHLGDMVPTGSSTEEWTRFLGIARGVLGRMAIVPVLGNHELIAPGGAALYREHFAMPDPRGAAYYVFESGGVRILVLDSNAPMDPGTPQYDFAMRELERAAADTTHRALFVAAHQGPYSSGRHGGLEAFETSGLVEAMRRARVDLVFSGHDHIYERGEAAGLKYVVSGGCGSPLYRANSRQPHQLAFVADYHHVRVRVDGTTTSLDVIANDGRLIERCEFERGHPFRCGRHDRSSPHGPRAGVSPLEDSVDRYGPRVALALAGASLGAYALARHRRARTTERI